MTTREIICKDCGVPFLHTGKGAPKYCPDHKPKSNSWRDRKALERRVANAEGIAAAMKLTPAAPVVKAPRNDARYMAVGLSIDPDPVEAAKWVGITLRGEELNKLAAEARAKFGAIVARKSTAVAESAHRSLLLMSIQIERRLLDQDNPLPFSQVIAGFKALAQSVDLLGATRQHYTELTVDFGQPLRAVD